MPNLEEVAGDSFISTTPSETGIAFGGKVLQVSHYLPAAGENRGFNVNGDNVHAAGEAWLRQVMPIT